ncbi:hypothetical protein IFR05_000200 [Cadophora sp. M221]|nr:hypothetical protein IFR05_000200 [Cadophora sp. M221]
MAPEHEITGGTQVKELSRFQWLKPSIVSMLQEFDKTFAHGLLGLPDREATYIQEEKKKEAEEIARLQTTIFCRQTENATDYHLEADDGFSTDYSKSSKDNSVSGFEGKQREKEDEQEEGEKKQEEEKEKEEEGPRLGPAPDTTRASTPNNLPRAQREPTHRSYDDSGKTSSVKPYFWGRELIQCSSMTCCSCNEKVQNQKMDISELCAKINANAQMYANFADLATKTQAATKKDLIEAEALVVKVEQEKKDLEQKAEDDAREACKVRENLEESRKTITDLTAKSNTAIRCDRYYQERLGPFGPDKVPQDQKFHIKYEARPDQDRSRAPNNTTIHCRCKRATLGDQIPAVEDEAQIAPDRTQSAEDWIPDDEDQKLKQLQKDHEKQTKALATVQRHLLILEPVVKWQPRSDCDSGPLESQGWTTEKRSAKPAIGQHITATWRSTWHC